MEYCEVGLLPWLNGYAHELFLHSHFIVYFAMHNFSTRGQKGFDKKTQAKLLSHPPYDV